MGHIHKFQGRLLPYTNSNSGQEVPVLLLQGSVIPFLSTTLWSVHSTYGVHFGSEGAQIDSITNRTSQRVCGHFGHSNNQYYKLLTQRREFPKLFQNRICHPPLLKKPNLDRNLLKNYRPVSNLSFISKLIEKVVAKQLNNYIDSEGLSNVNQSAYRRLHSTESALLKIQNDMLLRWTLVRLLHSHCWTSQRHSTLSTMTFFLIPSGIGLGLMALC